MRLNGKDAVLCSGIQAAVVTISVDLRAKVSASNVSVRSTYDIFHLTGLRSLS